MPTIDPNMPRVKLGCDHCRAYLIGPPVSFTCRYCGVRFDTIRDMTEGHLRAQLAIAEERLATARRDAYEECAAHIDDIAEGKSGDGDDTYDRLARGIFKIAAAALRTLGALGKKG